MSNQSLFAIGADLEQLDELLAEAAASGTVPDPEAVEALNAWMAELDADRAAKLDRVHGYVMQLEMEREACARQATEWRERAGNRERRVESVKKMVMAYMGRSGEKRIESASGIRFTVSGNGGKQPLVVTAGVDEVGESFRKVTITVDTDAIRTALEAGLALPYAHLEPRGTHLRIK